LEGSLEVEKVEFFEGSDGFFIVGFAFEVGAEALGLLKGDR